MEPILLTEKELWQAMLTGLQQTDPTHRQEVKDSQILNRYVAKVQLKKVYKNRLAEFVDDRGRECISVDKQSLLKECED